MILFKQAGDLTDWLQGQRSQGRSIGFVPTMGALHTGHISLIDISKKTTGITVCSIFVNPTQFNDPKDFQKYPITIEKDIYLLEKAGTDVLFLPEVEEVYPGGTKGLEKYDLGRLETLLEGKYRPGHFQGVCQVMRRLLDMVGPDELFMGQKDYQQCMVVGRLIELMKAPIRLHPCPIIREADGLAMSSRNMRLTATERSTATAIYRALTLIKREWGAGGLAGSGSTEGQTGYGRTDEGQTDHEKTGGGKTDHGKTDGGQLGGEQTGGGSTVRGRTSGLEGLLARARLILEEAGFRIDYVEVADAVTLEPIGPLGDSEGKKTGYETGTIESNATNGGNDRRAAGETDKGADGDTDDRAAGGKSEPGGGRKAVALVAAFLGEIRLIDNMLLQ